ncbi:papain family cysteine protease [Cooperia oncophora]
MSDRLCIATNGTVKVTLSADDIMTCCTICSLGFGSGCDGGSIYDAFKYFVSEGVVTGGDYGSMYGCRPYEIEPDISQLNKNSYKTSILSSTPPCRQACQLGFGKCYDEDKYYGGHIVSCTGSEEFILNTIDR